MILVLTGTRQFGELDYDKYEAKKLKRGTGRLDPTAVMCVTSFLDGLWTWATMGYLVTDLFGFTIIEGGCPTGTDRIGRQWAEAAPTHGYAEYPEDRSDVHAYPNQPPFDHRRVDADWSIGKKAGPLRNRDMIQMALDIVDTNEEILVAGFFDRPEEESKGTRNCIKQASAAGLPHITTRYYERI